MYGLRAVGTAGKVILALAALGLLLSMQVTGISAASAATSHQAAPVAQSHQAQPAITPSGTFHYAYPCTYGFCYNSINCTAGNHAAPANMKRGTQDSFVLNDCNVRVWLAQYSNGTGYTLCLSPNAGTVRVWLYRAFADVGVSTNGSHC
jgi:hypothetical protein